MRWELVETTHRSKSKKVKYIGKLQKKKKKLFSRTCHVKQIVHKYISQPLQAVASRDNDGILLYKPPMAPGVAPPK